MKFSAVLLGFFLCNNLLAQVIELKPEQMMALLPTEIDGYKSEEFKSRQLKVGTITYTFCEKKFNRGRQSIKLLLFDFSHADIMYQQAMRTWKEAQPVENDSIVQRIVAIDNCTGWESYRKHTGESQIFLGICGRYFLTISGEQVDLINLKSVLNNIALDKFPK